MTISPDPAASAAETILAYHQRTKHSLQRYAAGPETLDWDSQPNPFREYAEAPRMLLPLSADSITTTFAEIYSGTNVTPAPLSANSVGALMQLAMGLTAWKQFGPDRWALRSNPSSGNLHPTEAYVLSEGIDGLPSGVHHYVSRNHSLEQRCKIADDTAKKPTPRLWIGLSSVHWREAWKYGERAFRYCQLDVGHAIGALRYAAGALGWKIEMVEGLTSREVASLLGIDRASDFTGKAELETPDLIMSVSTGSSVTPLSQTDQSFVADRLSDWKGSANVLDRHPMYRWPVIDEAALATRRTSVMNETPYRGNHPGIGEGSSERATSIILNRRSAQAFDRSARMGSGAFYHLIDRLLPRPVAPWDVWTFQPRIHPVFFIHRVDGIEPGVYILVRNPEAEMPLRQAINPEFKWRIPDHVPPQLSFYRLIAGDTARMARTIFCGQAIASDACFGMGMIAEYEGLVRADPWRYKQLHWEAGLIGQVLYLESESLGFRGTGVGCYFDDSMHEVLGLKDAAFASLYHFTVGAGLVDSRIQTEPPYGERTIPDTKNETQGAAAMAEDTGFERVDVAFARDLIAKEEPLILDTRDMGSYEQGHIEGAEFVNDSNISNFLMTTPKDKPVLIYCYHGNASQVRAQTFTDFRFKKVYSLDGGFEAWVKNQ
jgi:SagB-type dehydrogenase family enzyme